MTQFIVSRCGLYAGLFRKGASHFTSRQNCGLLRTARRPSLVALYWYFSYFLTRIIFAPPRFVWLSHLHPLCDVEANGPLFFGPTSFRPIIIQSKIPTEEIIVQLRHRFIWTKWIHNFTGDSMLRKFFFNFTIKIIAFYCEISILLWKAPSIQLI